MSTQSDIAVDTKVTVKEPGQYNVIYLNDEKTTMQFVAESLIVHFEYDEVAAMEKVFEVHQKGSAVVATLPYELAEQKGVEVTLDARKQGFPLQVKVEAE